MALQRSKQAFASARPDGSAQGCDNLSMLCQMDLFAGLRTFHQLGKLRLRLRHRNIHSRPLMTRI
ncbi:hypothetical protein MPL1032_170062 [Mesorhizobium plurifarium]|uniref:Uncharacterized protein n=1 Tax=Mesorhizobium plurifarium TaxID=69974 RepID=A0A0K2VT72_MESPL|nr:hypothetical protein MPL1032_170062 [Mesorhizobium plurifarium]